MMKHLNQLGKYYYFILLVLLTLWILPLTSYAACLETEFIKPSTEMPVFTHKRNNLRRSTGGAYFAQGTPLFIKAIIQNTDCVPIANAVVTLWQADHQGNNADDVAFDKYLLNSGVTTSNNLGEFEFITIFPGDSKDHPAHVNLSINHPNISTVNTQLLLAPPAKYNDIADHNLITSLTQLPVATLTDSPNHITAYITLTLESFPLYRQY